MGNFEKDARKVFVWCWRIFIYIPAVYILIETSKTIAGGNTMGDITHIQYYSGILFLIPFVLGIIYLTISYIPKWIKERKGDITTIPKEDTKVPACKTSRVFDEIQSMDAQKISALFDGISKLSPEQITALFRGKIKEDKVDSGDSK